MRKLAVVVMLFGFALAQDWPVYSFTTSSDYPKPEPNVLEISCQPYEVDYLMENGSNVLLMCEARALKGYPEFYPFRMEYVVDGFQHDVTDEDYEFLGNMSGGNIHEGAAVQFRLAPTFLRRDVPISIYYGREGVTIPLPELLD